MPVGVLDGEGVMDDGVPVNVGVPGVDVLVGTGELVGVAVGGGPTRIMPLFNAGRIGTTFGSDKVARLILTNPSPRALPLNWILASMPDPLTAGFGRNIVTT